MEPRPPADMRLIALDLDDTLLGDDKSIDPRDLAALRRARARGVRVVLATGRTWFASVDYARQIGPDVPVIATGGAAVYDADGTLMHAWRLPASVVREVVGWADGRGVAVRVDLDDAFVFNRLPARDFWDPEGRPYRLQPHERVEHDVAKTLEVHPLQVVAGGREDVRAILKEFGYLEGELRLLALPDRDDPIVVHVTHPHATKGLALAYLCRRLGIPREATIAFGDGINDLPLLAFAGVAVAAERAVPAVRFLADDRAEGEGGIARVLEKLGVV